MIDEMTRETIISFQRNEITEHHIYNRLSRKVEGKNSRVLDRISKDELRHYNQWKDCTSVDVPPNRFMVLKFLIIARIFGLTFALKLMEGGEEKAGEAYARIAEVVPKANDILKQTWIEKQQYLLSDLQLLSAWCSEV